MEMKTVRKEVENETEIEKLEEDVEERLSRIEAFLRKKFLEDWDAFEIEVE